MSLILGTDLYTKPPREAVAGMQCDSRKIELTAAQIVNGNIVALGVLPAGCRLDGAYVESDDLDSGANTITLDLGVLNTYYNKAEASVAAPATYNSGGVTNTGTAPALVSGQNILTASTIAQAGGRIEYSALACSEAIGVDVDSDRIIAFEIKLVGTAQAGTLRLGLMYHPE